MGIGFDILLLPVTEVVLMELLARLVGAPTLVHRRIFFTESLTHATFSGMIVNVVTAVWFSWAVLGQRADFTLLSASVLVGTIPICLPMIWFTRRLSQIPGVSSQSVVGVALTSGFTLGYFFNEQFAPLLIEVGSFLTSSVLNVNRADIIVADAVLASAAFLPAAIGRFLTFYSFDPPGYCASGLKPAQVERTVMVMVTLTIVMSVPTIGTTLPTALIAALTAALAPWARIMSWLLIDVLILGTVTSLAGLLIAVQLNLSTGRVAAVIYRVVYLVSALLRWAVTRGAWVRVPLLRQG